MSLIAAMIMLMATHVVSTTCIQNHEEGIARGRYRRGADDESRRYRS